MMAKRRIQFDEDIADCLSIEIDDLDSDKENRCSYMAEVDIQMQQMLLVLSERVTISWESVEQNLEEDSLDLLDSLGFESAINTLLLKNKVKY